MLDYTRYILCTSIQKNYFKIKLEYVHEWGDVHSYQKILLVHIRYSDISKIYFKNDLFVIE